MDEDDVKRRKSLVKKLKEIRDSEWVRIRSGEATNQHNYVVAILVLGLAQDCKMNGVVINLDWIEARVKALKKQIRFEEVARKASLN